MQPPQSTPMAREAVESPAMSQSTTEIRIVPLAPSQDVSTDLLRDGARRLLAQAIEAEVATWIDPHAHLTDQTGRQQAMRQERFCGPARKMTHSGEGHSCPVRWVCTKHP